MFFIIDFLCEREKRERERGVGTRFIQILIFTKDYLQYEPTCIE